jgi:hypothetical protein
MSKVGSHFGVHNHLVVDGKCRESIKETKRLTAKEVDHTPNANIFSISLNVNKTFLASYLLDDSKDGTMHLFKGE